MAGISSRKTHSCLIIAYSIYFCLHNIPPPYMLFLAGTLSHHNNLVWRLHMSTYIARGMACGVVEGGCSGGVKVHTCSWLNTTTTTPPFYLEVFFWRSRHFFLLKSWESFSPGVCLITCLNDSFVTFSLKNREKKVWNVFGKCMHMLSWNHGDDDWKLCLKNEFVLVFGGGRRAEMVGSVTVTAWNID